MEAPELFFFEDEESAQNAADSLQKLGSTCIKLLSEVVAEQIIQRHKISPAMQKLWDEGFVFVNEATFDWDKHNIRSTLSGEEALERLEWMQEQKKKGK